MDAKLFEVLGKYAGLAGISIGLVLLIFLAVLKKRLPDSKQESSIILQVMYLTFAIGVIGILAWFFSHKVATTIAGRVSDSNTRSGVSDAEITLVGRTESAHSDGAGNFNLALVGDQSDGPFHMYVSKTGYKVYDRGVSAGQNNIEAELIPATPATETKNDSEKTETESNTSNAGAKGGVSYVEQYSTDDVASGACKDFGTWATLCTADKPKGWRIMSQHFELTGDRAGCAWAQCEPLGTITDTKACYRFRTQGHDEECGHSGNTGIHYSRGVLTVAWNHP
jgi:hypothetical protein